MIEPALLLPKIPVPPDYIASLAAGARDKAALFRPWIEPGVDSWIVDMGTGPGDVGALLAQSFSTEWRVLAVDSNPGMIDTASQRHDAVENVVFRVGDAREEIDIVATGWILSSVLHEVATQGGLTGVEAALWVASSGLTTGGRLLLRDFVRPPDASRRVLIEHHCMDIQPGRSFADLVAGASYPVRYDGFRLGTDHVSYETDMAGAYEFLFRKDWGSAWHTELEQRYGFWTHEQCRVLVQKTGFRIVSSRVKPNDWLIHNRVRDRLRIRDARTGEILMPPAYQLFLVAEKVPQREHA